MVEMRKQRVCLVIIDGWGLSSSDSQAPGSDGHTDCAHTCVTGNAIRMAETPVMDSLTAQYGCTPLQAHGEAVGLPAGLMGNSEVGHLNIGAGRVVYQDILRINKMLDEDDFVERCEVVKQAVNGKGAVHLVGLVSDGGVHSSLDHLIKLVDHLSNHDPSPPISIHVITDGRDCPPKSCLPYISRLQAAITGKAKISTVTGRYYAMDRDKRWERTLLAVSAMTAGVGQQVSDISEAIMKRYGDGETDEFLKPMVVEGAKLIGDGDSVIFFNFRSDRMKQIVQVLGSVECKDVHCDTVPKDLHITTMTRYREDFIFPVISPPVPLHNTLPACLASHSLSQLHVAETEKFSHVTVFFNGGQETPCPGEDRILIPSPAVATYDLCPEMSCAAVADAVIQGLANSKKDYALVMCNFAPPDMVGHTGILPAAIRAVEATDRAIGRVYEACQANGYTLLITADHGNVEKMIDLITGAPHTAHTCAAVPLILAHPGYATNAISREPALCDIAPTILHLLGIEQPEDMTGASLFRQLA